MPSPVLIQGLRAADLTGVRLVDPDGVHLTLKFLGNVDSSRVPALTDALDAVGEGAVPFALHLRDVGVFPDRRSPRVLWAGVSGDTEALAALARRVDDACANVGFPREQRPFSPHLTLARLRDRASADESPTRRNRSGRHWPPTRGIVRRGGVPPHQEHPHAIRPTLRYRPHRNP